MKIIECIISFCNNIIIEITAYITKKSLDYAYNFICSGEDGEKYGAVLKEIFNIFKNMIQPILNTQGG